MSITPPPPAIHQSCEGQTAASSWVDSTLPIPAYLRLEPRTPGRQHTSYKRKQDQFEKQSQESTRKVVRGHFIYRKESRCLLHDFESNTTQLTVYWLSVSNGKDYVSCGPLQPNFWPGDKNSNPKHNHHVTRPFMVNFTRYIQLSLRTSSSYDTFVHGGFHQVHTVEFTGLAICSHNAAGSICIDRSDPPRPC